MTPTAEQLTQMLVAHAAYLRGDADGRAINLAGANLAGADLTRANLAGADLTRANLAGANLAGADLTRANLAGADLAGADLAGADLTRANLHGADLAGANGLITGVEVVIDALLLRQLGACADGVEAWEAYGVERSIVDPRGLWALALGEDDSVLASYAAWLCGRLAMSLHPSAVMSVRGEP